MKTKNPTPRARGDMDLEALAQASPEIGKGLD